MIYMVAALCVLVLPLFISVEMGFRAILHRMDTIVEQLSRLSK
jgi:hypothetical protein